MAQSTAKQTTIRKDGDVFVYTQEGEFRVRPDPIVGRKLKKGYLTIRDLTGLGLEVAFQGVTYNVAQWGDADIDISTASFGRHFYAVYVGSAKQPAVGNSDPSIIVD